MRRDNRRRALAIMILFLSSFSLVLLGFSAQNKTQGHEALPLSQELRTSLMKSLVKEDALPDGPASPVQEPRSVIYVLGGAQKSLESRFKVAAYLYHHHIGKSLLILSRPGVTEYDSALRRNLTNDEWAIKTLQGLGVRSEDIEPISLEMGSFGTLTEARGISALASERGYTRLAVVSSAYHTMRVWLAFFGCLQNRGITLAVYGSDDAAGFGNLVMEYAKLMVYKYYVLPRLSAK